MGQPYGGVPMGQPYGGVDSNIGYANAFGQPNYFNHASPFQRGLYFMKGQRKRMNLVAIVIALLVPWALFMFTFGVTSFSAHFNHPYVAELLVGFAACCCLMAVFLAVKALYLKARDATYQPSWYVYIAMTCMLAFVVGFMGGESNYLQYLQPYYTLHSLAHYTDIDTNANIGSQLMDAGRIDFKAGTALDLKRSMGFKNKDVFCVAPIITKGGGANASKSVDFWAVGKNCCSGVQADFHCSGFSDPKATGVIRLMQDEDRAFYRLAVQQAEATYKMTATHPLFFEWVHSSEEAVNRYWHKGCLNFFMWIFGYFTFQGFLTVCTTMAFSKLVLS